MTDAPIRDAATVVVLRDGAAGPEVLMGQRGATAAFMPSKFVFPGGALDPGDADVALAAPLAPECTARLGPLAQALAAAAIRELWEETGLPLGTPGVWRSPAPDDWRGFAARGLVPDPGGLRFIFRAITPPGRPRRFDARFFLVEAGRLHGPCDDFSAACEELSHLQWIPLAEVRRFDLPFITEVVMAEVAAIAAGAPFDSVPFFDNSGDRPEFQRIA
ncbi:NUDIX hydrolase [Rhodobaculum claviforme]|uniref:DNA mismatch repair protein MutT n=1 Tax=Rhodobaculum claviforme TaxID=1549854 RepID=A0A934TMS1_9RHOB|nr:NUDIX domain-containing protein [Rhodobaculum claviforme]MBK5928732.1 DNA mismatch repair protein MutT [Rhodobaculum claviforme]